MRFKKGSKVEVMNKKMPPSWHTAEIVSGNGDAYNVRYNGYQGVQKVSRRFIRPSPTKHSKIYQKEDDFRLHKSHVVGSRNQKRASPFCSSVHEPCQKVKDGSESQRYVSGDSYKKVDAFVGNKYMHQASFNNNIKNGCYNEMEKRKTNVVDDDSDQCSVGSCSVIVSSDGDGDDVAVSVDIHRLELDAYRATLEALYASGPLSWEKEALLTNLRISLHISNDEHLKDLRHLISSN